MRLFRALLVGGCVLALAGCEPDLNDNECDTDQDCSYKPGTVCSPENWCVLPVAAAPNTSTPDASATQPDASAADAAEMPPTDPEMDGM